jgi:hypothetical protein
MQAPSYRKAFGGDLAQRLERLAAKEAGKSPR